MSKECAQTPRRSVCDGNLFFSFLLRRVLAMIVISSFLVFFTACQNSSYLDYCLNNPVCYLRKGFHSCNAQ